MLRNAASLWYIAKQRFFKGLAQNPQKKKKGKRDSVLLTKELFCFRDVILPNDLCEKELHIGTKTNQLGVLKFHAHRAFGLPKQIVISKKHGEWFVSFSYEDENIHEKTEEELIEEFSSLDEQSLTELTLGIDRGVAVPFQVSNTKQFQFSEQAQLKILKKQRRLKRYQKKLAKQKKASLSRNKTKQKIGKAHKEIANIRHDFCHKTSLALANSDAKIFAIEDLRLKNLTKSPAPKQDEKGNYLPNGRAAKAGLNRALLSKGLGKTIDFLEYKARRLGKLVVPIPAHHTSQECAKCSHTHPENRKTQANFFCLLCGNQDNADLNAAKVIAKRGIQHLLSKPKAKTKTRLGTSRSYAGRGISKTELEKSNPLIPMTPEARSL